jgi:hypothetical protein
MSLGFIARGYGLVAPSAKLSQATLLALLVDLGLIRVCWVSLGLWLMDGETMIAFGLLDFTAVVH